LQLQSFNHFTLNNFNLKYENLFYENLHSQKETSPRMQQKYENVKLKVKDWEDEERHQV